MEQPGKIMDLFRTDCTEYVSTLEELKNRERDACELNEEGGGVAAPKLPSLMRNTAVRRRNRLTAWMREDPDLVHSDVARMAFQRDGFKYHLQHTQGGSQFHRSGCRHWS